MGKTSGVSMNKLIIDERQWDIDELPVDIKARVGRMQEVNNEILALEMRVAEWRTVFQGYSNSVAQDLDARGIEPVESQAEEPTDEE